MEAWTWMISGETVTRFWIVIIFEGSANRFTDRLDKMFLSLRLS